MKRSLNEVQRICQKAAEGVGAPAGLDVEAAHGAAWLLAHDLPALADLAADLTRFDDLSESCRFAREDLGDQDQAIDASEKTGAVIAPMLIDLLIARAARDGGPGRLRVDGLTAPLFLLPPAVGYAEEGWDLHLSLSASDERRSVVRIAAGDVAEILGSGGDAAALFETEHEWSLDAVCAHEFPEGQGRTDLTVLLDRDQLADAAARSLAEGVSPNPEPWERLKVLAAKVLVPATQRSHLMGAGALGSDNE